MNKKELSKGFTGIEINGVRFSNIKEMLIYMNKQRVRIINLENENAELDCQKNRNKACYSCANATERCFRNEIACPCQKYKSYKEENAELRKVAEFQQSTSMSRHFEIKKLKEVLTVGTTWNKGLNSRNKYLEEEMDKYRNMVFDKDDQLTYAKTIIQDLLDNTDESARQRAEDFLKENK